jgi:N-acetyl-alpha-D-muramate 1-phosphate uridylyltransferase
VTPDATADGTADGGTAAGRGPFAGVVLAAGAGTRLRPLTDLRPKALCPVGTVPLLDLALGRLAPLAGEGPGSLAVNAHAFATAVRAHVGNRAHVSVETGEALGTAGALGLLRPWIEGRDLVVTNADAYLPGGLQGLVDAAGGWDGERSRLLCAPVEGPGDFPGVRPGLRYVGACLLPWTVVRVLAAEPTGLFEVLWRAQADAGLLELVPLGDAGAGDLAIDCGTPADYLAANLHAGAGGSVVDPTAVVEGEVERSVVWDGAHVAAGEHLVEVVRAGTRQHPVTVPAAHR